jgi:hypothetical protein
MLADRVACREPLTEVPRSGERIDDRGRGWFHFQYTAD